MSQDDGSPGSYGFWLPAVAIGVAAIIRIALAPEVFRGLRSDPVDDAALDQSSREGPTLQVAPFREPCQKTSPKRSLYS